MFKPSFSMRILFLRVAGLVFALVVAFPAAAASTEDLVLLFPFDQDSGATATDLSGNGNHGTVSATRAEGKFGQAVQFDGVDDAIRVQHSSSLVFSNAITVEAWVNLDAGAGSAKIMQKKAVSGSGPGGFIFGAWFANPAGHAFEVYDTQGQQHIGDTGVAPVRGTWQHVAGTFDGSTINMYLDGVLKKSTAYQGSFGANTDELLIGIQSNNLMPLKGKLDDIRIYRSALSASEIACDMQGNIIENGACIPLSQMNKRPTITASGPATLKANAEGAWQVLAADADGATFAYSVDWGDGTSAEDGTTSAPVAKTSTSFTHRYANAGSYNAIFSVADSKGAVVRQTVPVVVSPPAELSGNIFDPYTLRFADSPYTVKSNVVVFPGATLTVEPGTVVRFSAGTSLEIRGALVAEGIAEKRVRFTAVESAQTKGSWGGIRVSNTLGGRASLRFADVEFAQAALMVECCHSGGPLTIADSAFRNNMTALGGYAGNVRVTVDRTTFENNTNAVTSADKDIRDSTFRNNTYGLYQTERISVTNSTLTGHKVALWGGRGTVSGSTITGNETGVQAFYEGFTLEKNTITNNGVGVILGQYDGTTPTIRSNNIHGNTTYNLKVTGSANKTVADNWWGTTASADIDAKIYDGKDDPTLGLAVYSPVRSLPIDINQPTSVSSLIPPSTPWVSYTGAKCLIDGDYAQSGIFTISWKREPLLVNRVEVTAPPDYSTRFVRVNKEADAVGFDGPLGFVASNGQLLTFRPGKTYRAQIFSDSGASDVVPFSIAICTGGQVPPADSPAAAGPVGPGLVVAPPVPGVTAPAPSGAGAGAGTGAAGGTPASAIAPGALATPGGIAPPFISTTPQLAVETYKAFKEVEQLREQLQRVEEFRGKVDEDKREQLKSEFASRISAAEAKIEQGDLAGARALAAEVKTSPLAGEVRSFVRPKEELKQLQERFKQAEKTVVILLPVPISAKEIASAGGAFLFTDSFEAAADLALSQRYAKRAEDLFRRGNDAAAQKFLERAYGSSPHDELLLEQGKVEQLSPTAVAKFVEQLKERLDRTARGVSEALARGVPIEAEAQTRLQQAKAEVAKLEAAADRQATAELKEGLENLKDLDLAEHFTNFKGEGILSGERVDLEIAEAAARLKTLNRTIADAAAAGKDTAELAGLKAMQESVVATLTAARETGDPSLVVQTMDILRQQDKVLFERAGALAVELGTKRFAAELSATLDRASEGLAAAETLKVPTSVRGRFTELTKAMNSALKQAQAVKDEPDKLERAISEVTTLGARLGELAADFQVKDAELVSFALAGVAPTGFEAALGEDAEKLAAAEAMVAAVPARQTFAVSKLLSTLDPKSLEELLEAREQDEAAADALLGTIAALPAKHQRQMLQGKLALQNELNLVRQGRAVVEEIEGVSEQALEKIDELLEELEAAVFPIQTNDRAHAMLSALSSRLLAAEDPTEVAVLAAAAEQQYRAITKAGQQESIASGISPAANIDPTSPLFAEARYLRAEGALLLPPTKPLKLKERVARSEFASMLNKTLDKAVLPEQGTGTLSVADGLRSALKAYGITPDFNARDVKRLAGFAKRVGLLEVEVADLARPMTRALALELIAHADQKWGDERK